MFRKFKISEARKPKSFLCFGKSNFPKPGNQKVSYVSVTLPIQAENCLINVSPRKPEDLRFMLQAHFPPPKEQGGEKMGFVQGQEQVRSRQGAGTEGLNKLFLISMLPRLFRIRAGAGTSKSSGKNRKLFEPRCLNGTKVSA